jgi:hypothetical protein
MLERRRVTRSGVTRISVLVAVAAAVWFSRADLAGALAGSALLGLVLFCDTVRSRMRANRRDSLTVWSASMAAQLREYAVYVGLAFGAVAAGFTSAWGWAAGALIALALRDALLVARSAPAATSVTSEAKPPAPPAQRRAEGFRVPPPRPGSTASTAAAATTPAPSTTAPALDSPAAPETEGGLSPVLLARQVMVFGQPTRFLVIAVATVAVDARIAFLSLIVGCVVAITGELVDPSSRVERR